MLLGTLLFLYSMEVGFLPDAAFIMYQEPEIINISGSIYTDLEGVVSIGGVYIGGGIKTYVWAHSAKAFWPHTTCYRFLAGFKLGILEFGFRHYCTHPVVPYLPCWQPQQIFEGAVEELFIRASNK